MLRANVGSSTVADAYAAGREAAGKARVDGAKVAFAFTSCDYDQQAFLK